LPNTLWAQEYRWKPEFGQRQHIEGRKKETDLISQLSGATSNKPRAKS
jgi:hypothetical protein